MIEVGSEVMVWPIQRSPFLMDPGTGRRGIVTGFSTCGDYVHVDIGLHLYPAADRERETNPPLDCKRLLCDVLECRAMTAEEIEADAKRYRQ